MSKRALVTGANGFVGSNLVRELLGSGYEVTAMHRGGSNLETLKDLPIKFVAADITKPEELSGKFSDIDVVFHIAALFRQAKDKDEVYWDVNYNGVKNVFEEVITSGVKKIIHCSTVGVHSHIPQPPANEKEAHRPGDIYQETKSAGEKLAAEYFASGKIAGAIIRPAMIWGPGDERTLKLFKGIKTGKMPLIGGKTHVHWILVTDLARSFRLAAEKNLEPGETFIISGAEAVPMKRLYETVARSLGVKAPKFALPAWPFQIAGDICELICKPFGIEPPLYRRRVDFFTKTRWFDSSKAHKLLGFEPANNFSSEVQLISDWYKSNSWL